MNIKMETRLHSADNNNSIKKGDLVHNRVHHHLTKSIDNKCSFQSEYARSLAYNNDPTGSLSTGTTTGQNQSLDFALSFRIENKNCSDSSSMLSSSASRSPSPIKQQPQPPSQLNDRSIGESTAMNNADCPADTASSKFHCINNNINTSKYVTGTGQFRFQQVSALLFCLQVNINKSILYIILIVVM